MMTAEPATVAEMTATVTEATRIAMRTVNRVLLSAEDVWSCALDMFDPADEVTTTV